MSNLLKLKKPTRFAAALLALCYLWLSAVTSLQHTHDFGEDTEEIPAVVAPATTASPQTAATLAQSSAEKHVEAAKTPSLKRCNACEWQAANVSPALPAFVFRFTPPIANRAVTTFPRYLRLPAFIPASRGPPAV